ncbi:unnamed protein product [Closterium sp. NIES-64]|nr:unnamed protein product [Closterium sp. NIES-64]
MSPSCVRWRVALESGAGEWRWRVALESGAGEWRWRVALESGAGEWRWRVALEGGAGEWRWRVTLESGAGEWRWRVTLQHWLAASESYPQLGGLLSQDSATNPLFHGWNLVWVVYCDGGAYSSTRGRADLGEGTSVYMQGWQILDDIITGGQQIVDHLTTGGWGGEGGRIRKALGAMEKNLCTQRGMGAALHVLYSGSSAGGHAIIMHCDRLAAAFPHAKATCLANSGFFVDAKDRFGVYSWRESIQQLTALHLIEVPKCPAVDRHAAEYRESRAALQLRNRAAQQPSRRATKTPSRRAARRRAAQQPSRRAVEPPDAEPPCRPALTRRAARPPSRPSAEPPVLPRLCDRVDGLSLFDLTSGASPAPAADADPTVRSQWATCDAAARLADLLVETRAPPSLRGVLLPPCCLLLPLLLPPTCLVLSRSARRLPLAGDAALAEARGARARVELAGAVEVAVEAAEGVGVAVGVVAGVVAVVAAAEAGAVAAAAVGAEAAVVAEVEAVVAEEVEPVGVVPRSGAALVVVRASSSSSSVLGTSPRLSSSVSGTRSVSVVEVLARAPTFFAAATARQFPDATEFPRWGELSRAGVAIFDLDFDAILAAMYAVTISDEGDCYRCFPPDPCIGTASLGACETAALGASVSALSGNGEAALSGTGEAALSGTASTSASLTFTLDSGASRYFFKDRTTLTPLGRPVAVSLADPSGGLVLSHFSTVLSCPAAPSGTLSGLYLPSFLTNLVSGADLQDAGVHQFTPASQQVTHCSDARTGRHLATFSRRPGSSLYTLTTPSPPVPASSQVATSGQVFPAASRSGPESAPCSCRLLSHETLLWHHRLGHPSLPRLRDMASRVLVSGLPRSLPSLPLGPGPSCVPCVEGWLRADPHSSQFPPTEAPLQTLHMDVWGPARVRGQGHERYILLVVDDYSRYTTVFPLRSKGDVTETFTLPDSPQQNGIAERRIGMVMDVARWQFYHPSSRRVLSSQDVTFDESVPFYRLFPYRTPSLPPPPHFLVPGPPPVDPLPPQGPAPSGVSQVDAVEPVEVAGDFGTAAGAEPGGADSGGAVRVGAEPRGAESGGAATEGAAEPGGAASGAAKPGGAASGAAEPGGAEPAAAGPSPVAYGGAVPGGSPGALSRREPLSPQELHEWFASRWRRTAGARASSAAEGAGAAGPSATGPAGPSGAGAPKGGGTEPAARVPAARGAVGAGAATGGASAVPAVSAVLARPRPYFVPLLQQVLSLSPPVECPPPVQSQSLLEPASPLPSPSPYTGPTGGLAEHREPASRPASPVCAARASGHGSRQRPPPVPGTHRMSLRPSTAPLRAPLPSPPESSLPALTDPESNSLRAASPTVTRLLATVFTDPSFDSTAASALVAELVDFAACCRLDYAASLVAESASICPPSVGGECALGTDVLEDRQEEFQCLAAASPHLASVLLAPEGDPDAPDIPTPRSYAEAIEGPYSSQWQAAMDAEMASWKSTAPTLTRFPLLGRTSSVASAQRDYELHSLDFSTAFLQGSLHEEIWLRRPPGFTGTFPPGTQWSLRRPVYGLRQAPRQWHDTMRTTLAALGFAPSTADPSLFLRTDTSLPPFYILVYVDDLVFATADTAGLAYVKSELQKRHTCTDLGELRSYLGLQITRDRARRTITLTQSHMVQQVLKRFGFTYSSPHATPLPTRHSLSALPSDESVESSGPYPELVGCLMYLMTCTRPDLAYPLSILARYVAPGRHRPEHMAAAKRVLRYLCSTSGMGIVLGGQSPVVHTGHADASWADDHATQRSSQGYTFSLGSGYVS